MRCYAYYIQKVWALTPLPPAAFGPHSQYWERGKEFPYFEDADIYLPAWHKELDYNLVRNNGSLFNHLR